MKSSTLALHGAQVIRIESYTDYKVFDETPENEPYPYIVMGGITAKWWGDKLKDGMEIYSTIHIWSQYRGRKEADEMSDAILQALTKDEPIGLGANFRAALDRLDGYNLLVDLDGKTRHGILRFKYYIEEI